MLVSRIDIPDQVPGMTAEEVRQLRERVEAADALVRAEVADLYGHTVRADWSVPPADPPGRVELALSLGPVRLSWRFAADELAPPLRAKEFVREFVTQLTRSYLRDNVRAIVRLAEEIKADRARGWGIAVPKTNTEKIDELSTRLSENLPVIAHDLIRLDRADDEHKQAIQRLIDANTLAVSRNAALEERCKALEANAARAWQVWVALLVAGVGVLVSLLKK